VSHHGRPELALNTPTHVTLRVRRDVPHLRTKVRVRALRQCLVRARAKPGFRVVHYTVLGNHLHLIIEADSKGALSSGMNGLASRMARGVNETASRRGAVFSDRYHARVLKTPQQTRNTFAYVLLNFRRHMAKDGRCVLLPQIDVFSSGVLFDGWKERRETSQPAERECVALAKSWLLRTGWRRHGLISLREVPGPEGKTSRTPAEPT
jgi:REP element-mobilizing transposase RayT